MNSAGQPPPTAASGKLAKRSLGVTAAMSAGAAMELLRDVAVARGLNMGLVTDAFFLGIVIPTAFAGALQSISQTVFLPWFGSSLAEGEQEARERVTLLFLVALLPAVLIAGAGVVLAPQIARLLAGTTIDLDLLTVVVRYALPALGLTVEIAVISAYLNATGHYTAVAARRALNNGAFLVVFFFLRADLSASSLGLAFLAGYVVEFGSLALTGLHRTRLKDIPAAFQHWDELLVVLRSALFPTVAFGFARLNLVVERVLAGYLTVGSVTAVTLARRSTLAIATIAAQGVNTVTLSEMSRLKEAGTSWQGKRLLTSGLRLAVLLLVPIAGYLVVFHEPITRILFAGRNADQQVLSQAANLMMLFGIAIPLYVISPLLLGAFYAVGDTRTPSLVTMGAVALNILLNLALVFTLGTLGIGIAFNLTMIFYTLLGGWLVSRKFEPFVDRELIQFSLKVLVSVVATAFFAAVVYWLLGTFVPSPNALVDAGLVAISVLSSGLVLLIMLYTLRVEEIMRTWQWVRARLLPVAP